MADSRRLQDLVDCLYAILHNNNKSHQLFLRKRWHVFTIPHCIETPLFSIVLLSMHNYLFLCVS